MGKHLCAYLCPEKLSFIMGCNCNYKEIRASLVLESFSEESCILGKNHLSESLRISHWICFCVLDSGKDAAALANPPTSGHLTTGLLEAIWWDLVSSVQTPTGFAVSIFRLRSSLFAYLLIYCSFGDWRFLCM